MGILAPGINNAKNDLTNAYQGVLSLDGFSQSSRDLVIVKLPEGDPDWLPPVRNELKQLKSVAANWITDTRPKAWSQTLLQFLDYAPTFHSVSSSTGSDTSKEQWLELLQGVLLPQLKKINAEMADVNKMIDDDRSGFSAVLPLMDKSIQAGWNELGKEESEMLKLATEIGGLQQLACSYGAKLTSDIISGGKSYIQSSVKMLYSAASAGAEGSIPILGIAAVVFSIGKSYYDIIKDNENLLKTMQRIDSLQQELTADAQALSLTKATLQVLYNLEKNFLASRNAIPALQDLWSTEQTKVQDAIDALNAGADPKNLYSLFTMPVADTQWQEVCTFVHQLQDTDISMGAPVELDIGKATITQLPMIA